MPLTTCSRPILKENDKGKVSNKGENMQEKTKCKKKGNKWIGKQAICVVPNQQMYLGCIRLEHPEFL